MCERFTNRYNWRELVETFQLAEPYLTPILNFRPRFNIAATQRGVVIRLDRKYRREPVMMRWGLVSSWASDEAEGERFINVTTETAANKRQYRRTFLYRRCLVAADGFYGWKPVSAYEKKPYFVTLKGQRPIAFAGIWERWRVPKSPPTAPMLETFAILTTPPNAVCEPFRNRMPAILTSEDWPMWLGETKATDATLRELLVPFAAAQMDAWPIDGSVLSPENDGPELIARVA